MASNRRRRGHIEELPSGSFRASVYADVNPLTKKPRYLREAHPTYKDAGKTLTRLQNQVDEQRHPKSAITVRQAIVQWLEVEDHATSTRDRYYDRRSPEMRKRYAARNQGNGAGDVEVKALGLTPRTDYAHIGQVAASAVVADALHIEEGAPVLVRRRRLFADDEPTQLADSYIPWDIVGGTVLLDKNVGRGGSYTRLAELGHGPVRFTEEVSVRAATDEEARLLDLDGGQPVIDIAHIA